MAFSQLRPLGIGEILDGAFTIYRRHFASFFLTALIAQVPAIVAGGVYAAVAGVRSGVPASQSLDDTFLALFLTWPVWALSTLVALAAGTFQFARAYTGMPVTTGEALKRAMQRFFPMLGAFILVMLMATLGLFACCIGIVVVLASTFAVAPAVMLERRGPIDAISRSWQLVSGAWLEVFVVGFVVFMLQWLPGLAVSASFGLGATAVGASTPGGKAVAVCGQVVAGLAWALVIPFWLGTKVLLYYDRRVRLEALDVQMMTESLNALPGVPADSGYGPPPADQPMPRWG